MKIFRVLIVVLAVAGTAAFVLAARSTPRKVTAISAIQPSMNYAYVQIEGVVTSYPNLSPDSVSFVVRDTNGDIRVSAFRDVLTQLRQQNKLPMPGDRATIEGTLRVRDDDAALVINTPQAVALVRADGVPIDLAAMDAMRLGDRVIAGGQVRRVRNIADTLQVATLRDASGTADVLLPLNLISATLQAGDWISVTGAVGEYRNTKQLLPTTLVPLPPTQIPAPTLRPMSTLNKALAGQFVWVDGVVADVTPFAKGTRLLLQSDTGEQLVVVAFDSVWNSVAFSQTLAVNDRVQVQGELAEYRGELELVPEFGFDVALVK